MNEKHPLIEELVIFDQSSKHLREALLEFKNSWTPSYTFDSKKYNIWSLVRDHLDHPIETSIKDMTSFPLSRTFSQHGKYLYDKNKTPDKMNTKNRKNTKKEGDGKRGLLELIDATKKMSYDSQKNEMSYGRQKKQQIYIDLEQVIEVIYFLKTIPYSQNKKTKTEDFQQPFCELCWRLAKPKNPERKKYMRFCSHHNPSVPSSRYRTDHRYKKAFNEWLSLLLKQKPSTLEASIQEQSNLRKKAYDLAHAKLTYNRMKIIQLGLQGYSQAEIGEILGISRQAVYKSFSKVESGRYFRTWGEFASNKSLQKHFLDER